MSIKIDRANHGPGWIEVILGALISVVLGAVIGALLLVFRPVVALKDSPKQAEFDPKAVYFVQGLKDPSKGRSALAKRQSFLDGQSVTVNEDELNLLSAPAPASGTVADKGKASNSGSPAASPETFVPGASNFRLRDGTLQVGVPVTVNALGLSHKLVVQTRGTFVKQGDVFVFEPAELFAGSLPLRRLPFAATYVRDKFLASQPIPDDIKAAWVKLANVAIEGSVLKLTMP